VIIDRSKLLRDFDAGQFLDLLFVSAVVTVLGIRFFLAVTGYPKLGGASLHVAHMLWGGLLMLVALVLLLSFLDRAPRRFGALIGGVGFGTFIDEVGKFVTHDSDYCYHPSVANIYVVFVLIYIAIRSLHRDRTARREEYLANALSEMTQVATGDLDRQERDRALRYLELSGGDDPFSNGLGRVLQAVAVQPEQPDGFLTRWARRLSRVYRDLAVSRRFGQGMIAFFFVQLILKLARVIELIGLVPDGAVLWRQLSFFGPPSSDAATTGLVLWLEMGASLLSGVFVGAGVVLVFRHRLRSLRMFQRSILTTLILTQVFVFYRTEWLGLGELLFNLLIFFALRFAIDREKHWRRN